MCNFKVGDRVRLGISGRLPTIDFDRVSFDPDSFAEGEVVFADDSTFKVYYHEAYYWCFPQPSRANAGIAIHPAYPVLVGAEKVVEPIWRELICNDTSISRDSIPAHMLDSLIDRGERGVRRTQRAWPHMKVLEHKIVSEDDGIYLHWFWRDEKTV